MTSGPLVIIGDSMLDIDIEGAVTRRSQNVPIPVVDADRVWQRAGGAGLAAVLAARGESDVVLITAIGDDPYGRSLTDLLHNTGVRLIALALAGTTICKTTIRSGGQSILRLDHGNGFASRDPLPDAAVATIAEARAICVVDHGNGLTGHRHLRDVLTGVSTRVPLVWDPHSRGADPVPDAALVTPDEAQAQGYSVEQLRQRWKARAVCVTPGARGALLATGSNRSSRVGLPTGRDRADSGEVVDRFAVAAAAEFGRGADALTATTRAVETASRFVAPGGAVAVSVAAALVAGTAPGSAADQTIVSDDITAVRDRLRHRGGTLVATGGCFDLLHTGHVRLLHQARQLGAALIVLLNSDDSVRTLKGPKRPVMTAPDRARLLAALACVDAVCIFDEHSPEAALELLRPDVWVKGGDYRAEELPEADVVLRHGGEVVILPTVAGYSSSKLIATVRS